MSRGYLSCLLRDCETVTRERPSPGLNIREQLARMDQLNADVALKRQEFERG